MFNESRPDNMTREKMEMAEEKVAEGTTTIGITTEDAVVLATERRASMGNLIASKTAKKIQQINDRAAMTISGSVGGGQDLAKTLKVESNLYEMRRGKPLTMQGLASMAGNVMRYGFYLVHPLMGGVDKDGPHIYTLDVGGGVMEEDFASTGSGSVIAYGVLEDKYEEGMSLEEAKELAVRGLNSAMERDSASGDGMRIATITDEGFEKLETEEIDEIAESL